MTDVLRALEISGAVFALCYAVHICGRMWERAEQAREVVLAQALEASRKPELANTDYCVCEAVIWEGGELTFLAHDDASAAAYLICRSAREAVS